MAHDMGFLIWARNKFIFTPLYLQVWSRNSIFLTELPNKGILIRHAKQPKFE